MPQLPFVEQPITQSASLLQVEPALSEPGIHVPSCGPLGLYGQLSAESGMPSPSLSIIDVVEVVGGTVVVGCTVVVVVGTTEVVVVAIIGTEVVVLVVNTGTVVDGGIEVVVVTAVIIAGPPKSTIMPLAARSSSPLWPSLKCRVIILPLISAPVWPSYRNSYQWEERLSGVAPYL